MDAALVALVWQRAQSLCEYCLLPQAVSCLPFEIDHIIAQKHGGATVPSNLSLSCFYCNRYKGPNIAGVDRESGRVARLFHPRNDSWNRHFRWERALLAAKTMVGRVTLSVLAINHPDAVTLRQSLIEEGVFPPKRKQLR